MTTTAREEGYEDQVYLGKPAVVSRIYGRRLPVCSCLNLMIRKAAAVRR